MRFSGKVLIAMLFIWHSASFAIGAGQVALHSSLGETLMIEMPIIGADQYDDEQMSIMVGSLAQYQKMGVEFSHLHQQLTFSIIRTEDNNPILIIASRNPINEPFLNFVIEIMTPDGNLLKEVSVLLDTPST